MSQSNVYAFQDNKHNFDLTKEEFYIFIKYSRMRLYWSSDDGLRMNLIANLSINRYELILRYLHFVNNIDKDNTDKLQKIRPFLDKVQRNFISSLDPEEFQAIDEQIVPLKGRFGVKQYLPNKPQKWGIKIWVRAGVSGYIYV